MTQNLRDDTWWRVGVQYYVSGRWCAKSHLTLIAGNLFHHAFEMIMKARLLENETPKALRKIGHDLPILWDRYKLIINRDDLDLGKFDKVIIGLHTWDDARYTDLEKGFSSIVGWSNTSPKVPRFDTDDPDILKLIDAAPHYELFIEQVDELFNVLIETYPINPKVIEMTLLGDEAKSAYNYQRFPRIGQE